MNEQSVAIDYDFLEADGVCFSDLQQAAQQLSQASEAEFNAIKDEKWFTRVFDLVTLSNKKEIRLANQIENVAQAQQILMEILVRLSKRDTEISNLVDGAFTNIEKLSHHDILLAQKLRKLENQYLFGINDELTLDELTDDQQRILGGMLLEASRLYDPPSPNQQDYAYQLLTYLDVQPINIDLEQAIQSFSSIEDRKLLLRVCLEYAFLHQFDFDLSANMTNLIDEFELGNKTIKELKNKVVSHYHLLGKSGFTERYQIEALDEFFSVDMTITEEAGGEEVPSLSDLEHLTISEMVHIAKSDTVSFKNRAIYINTLMNVEGNLNFENCVINYAVPNTNSQITLNEAATLTLTGCKIVSHSENKKFFIEGKGENDITIMNCEFAQCGYFFTLESSHHVTIANSYFDQPRVNLLKSSVWNEDSIISLNQCQIKFNYLHNAEDTNDYFIDGVFNSNGQISIEDCEIVGDECAIRGSGDRGTFEGIQSTYFVDYPFLFVGSGKQIKVKQVSFNHVKNIFNGDVNLSECEFNDCLNIVDSYSYSDEGIVVQNCLFLDSEHLFSGNKLLIKNTQFKDCRNQIASGREVTIEFCEFYNLTNDLPDSLFSDGSNFIVKCMKDSAISRISKCIFDGVHIERNFLMEANTTEKIKGTMVEVMDCEFRNVRTGRPTGVLLKQYSSYFGLLGREIETKPLRYSNCVGLDNINDGAARAESIILRGTTSTGTKIGIGVAGVMAGIPGLAISLGVSKLFKDDDLTQE